MCVQTAACRRPAGTPTLTAISWSPRHPRYTLPKLPLPSSPPSRTSAKGVRPARGSANDSGTGCNAGALTAGSGHGSPAAQPAGPCRLDCQDAGVTLGLQPPSEQRLRLAAKLSGRALRSLAAHVTRSSLVPGSAGSATGASGIEAPSGGTQTHSGRPPTASRNCDCWAAGRAARRCCRCPGGRCRSWRRSCFGGARRRSAQTRHLPCGWSAQRNSTREAACRP